MQYNNSTEFVLSLAYIFYSILTGYLTITAECRKDVFISCKSPLEKRILFMLWYVCIYLTNTKLVSYVLKSNFLVGRCIYANKKKCRSWPGKTLHSQILTFVLNICVVLRIFFF